MPNRPGEPPISGPEPPRRSRAADFEARGFGAAEGGGARSWSESPADEGAAREAGGWAGPYVGRGPQGWRRSDARVRELVCERLMEDRQLDASGVELQVDGGVVTLSGEVPRPADVDLAERLARQAGGVLDVRNNLKPRADHGPRAD